MGHRSASDLEAGLDAIRRSPALDGRVELIVRRPAVDAREELDEGVLDPGDGLVGDSWRQRAGGGSAEGPRAAGRQLTLMNARVAALVAGEPGRRGLAGDQL